MRTDVRPDRRPVPSDPAMPPVRDAPAGSCTATFTFEAGPFECVDSVTGRGDRPYARSAVGSVTVVVG